VHDFAAIGAAGLVDKQNLKQAKAKPRYIKDACFAKKRGLKETEQNSSWFFTKNMMSFQLFGYR
jgi:hypothetical protein